MTSVIMTPSPVKGQPADAAPSAQTLTPKVFTVLREGYGVASVKADTIAGLTVAIVALPLSMAIAIASGVSPERGLYTAIAGGFMVSALGGSRFQIGGPAGAFIVLVGATVESHGLEGLILATFLSGGMLAACGLLRLGTFVQYIPYPVTVGFTAGIAVIIGASQISTFLGLALAAKEPGPLVPKLTALANALPTLNLGALAIAALSLAAMIAMRRHRPKWPGFLIAISFASVATYTLGLPIETIGSKFGGIPAGLPWPQLPVLSIANVREMLPAAAAFTLLGSIESLLSAVVADSMTGRRHRPNIELFAQGVANATSALFGGFCVTGTIARTATNVRSGAKSPFAGMLHSLFLLLIMMVGAPLAVFIPLPAMAAVLVLIAWNMAEKREFAYLFRASTGDAAILAVTFLLVIFRDLTEGIVAGFCVGALVFLHRMAGAVEIDKPSGEQAGRAGGEGKESFDPISSTPEICVFRISGAFFFGAAAKVATALDRIGANTKAFVIDCAGVSMLDSTAAATIEVFVHQARRQGAAVYIAGASPTVRRALMIKGVRPPNARFRSTIGAAIASACRRERQRQDIDT